MSRRRKSPITTARQANRTLGILLGDAAAIRRGRVGQRIANRVAGRLIGNALRGVWR